MHSISDFSRPVRTRWNSFLAQVAAVRSGISPALRSGSSILTNTRGAIDLASIMVGVLVIGIIGGVIAATVFAVIPWAQDRAAKDSLAAVTLAEGVAQVNPGDNLGAGYRSFSELRSTSLIEPSRNVVVGTNNKRSCFVSVSRSGTGAIYFNTNADATAVLYSRGATKTDFCLDIDSLVQSLPMDGVNPSPVNRMSILDAVGATAQSSAANSGGSAIERGHVQTALSTVRAEHPSETTAWADIAGGTVPADGNTFSVAFDNGQGSASGLPDSFGTRSAVVTHGDGQGYVGVVFTLAGQRTVCLLTSDTSTAVKLLAAVGDDMTCPGVIPAAGTSAISSMWAWGNSVDPSADNRGLGQADMTAAKIASYSHDHGLTMVYLSTPWAANQGAVGVWLSDTVTALHAQGIKVSALGGDPAWIDQPSQVAQWITDARGAANFDAVQLDIEPWAGAAQTVDANTYAPKLISLLDSARAAAGTLRLGMDLPWWLAETSYSGGTVIDDLLPKLDSVAIVTFADHAAGSDGIIALSTSAVNSAVAAGKPFTIGVETDTDAVAGGAQYTFFDEGRAVLERETGKVRTAFTGKSGYAGVTVEHMRAWAALKN